MRAGRRRGARKFRIFMHGKVKMSTMARFFARNYPADNLGEKVLRNPDSAGRPGEAASGPALRRYQ